MTAARPATGSEAQRRSDAAGVAFTSLAVACTVSAFALSSQSGPMSWLAGQILLAAALTQWFVALHECAHGTLFATRVLNTLTGHVAGGFALIPYRPFKAVHALHHRFTGWQDLDPTTASLVPRRLGSGERWLIDLSWRLWLPLFSILYRAGNYWHVARLRALFPAERRHLTASVVVSAALYCAAAAAIGPQALLRLVALGLLLALVFQDLLILSQHTHLPMRRSGGDRVRPFSAQEQLAFTRSLRFPRWFARLVLCNFNAHELHHLYPAVPGWQLASLDVATPNTVDWLDWVRGAKRLSGSTLLFSDHAKTAAVFPRVRS